MSRRFSLLIYHLTAQICNVLPAVLPLAQTMHSFNSMRLSGKSPAESRALVPAACPSGEEGRVGGRWGPDAWLQPDWGMSTWNSHFWFHLLISLC